MQWELGHIATLEHHIRDAKSAVQLAQVRAQIFKKYSHLLGNKSILKLNFHSGSTMNLGQKKQDLLLILKNLKDQYFQKLK